MRVNWREDDEWEDLDRDGWKMLNRIYDEG